MVNPTPYDPSEFLATGADQAELLDDALRSGNAAYVAHALGIVAKARGMSEIARKTGVKRQSLYSALDEGGNPTLSTFMAVIQALGFSLRAEAKAERSESEAA